MAKEKKITPKPETPDCQRVAVVGMGPVGMILAVKLKAAGFEVAVCDTDRIKVNLLRKDGLFLEGVMTAHEKFDFVCSDLAELREFKPDGLVLALKSFQTQGALNAMESIIHDNLFVICAQNGLDVELISIEALGEKNVMRMVINYAGNLIEPNKCKVNFFNPPNYLASMDDSRILQAQYIATKLTEVGLDTKAMGAFEILPRIWEKTILNSSLSALCAIGKLTIREAMELPDTVEVIEQVISEAVEVAEVEKIRFEDDFIRKCLRYLKKAGDHFPSLAVDLLNNSPTEIDYLNGKIVEYGKKHYIRTSLNLVFTNMVKAMTQKNLKAQMGGAVNLGQNRGVGGINIPKTNRPKITGNCFLGIDLGSAYTKFAVIDEAGQLVFKSLIRTHNSKKVAINHVVEGIYAEFPVVHCCATGYGRKNFLRADVVKTEINCAAAGASLLFPGEKYLNDKCAAGTGSFLTEVADRAEINIGEMSLLASRSSFDKELNSFCTVFAKTEIMGWLIDGVNVENICRGLYHSIVNRVAKMRVDIGRPVVIIGGVIAHHPYLRDMLEEKLQVTVKVPENPQHIAAMGAALIAKDHFKRQLVNSSDEKIRTI